jgi:hypothetical protein
MDEDKDKNTPQTQEGVPTDPPAVEPTEEPTEPVVEEPTEEPTEEEPVDEPTEEPEEPPVDPAPSPRENKRIEQLTKKLAESEQRRQDPNQPKNQKPIIGEGDYDLDQINGLARDYGAEQYQAGLAQANAIAFQTRLEIDVPKIAQKYEVMNPDAEAYDPGVTILINEEYLKMVGYNPQTGQVQRNDIRYEEFVEAQFEKAARLNSISAAQSTKNLAKQAAKTGMRPGGAVKKPYQGDDPRKMTDDQLDEIIKANLGITK